MVLTTQYKKTLPGYVRILIMNLLPGLKIYARAVVVILLAVVQQVLNSKTI